MADVSRTASIAVSYEPASQLISSRPAELLTGKASGQPQAMTTRILGTLVSREVIVDPGSPTVVEKPVRTVTVSFSIRAKDRPEWFPVFSGDLELTATSETTVELALEGVYSVPGGFVGKLADKGGLHRIVDDSIDRFFDSIVERLRAGTGSFGALKGVPHG